MKDLYELCGHKFSSEIDENFNALGDSICCNLIVKLDAKN